MTGPIRTAVVTGAASGLGRAFVRRLAGGGVRVLASDVDVTGLEETRQLAGGDVAIMETDVRDADAIEHMAARADETFGTTDLVVNNAGVAAAGEVGIIPLDDWRWTLDVNLRGVVYGCHVFVPRMRAAGAGAIINVASTAGLISVPGAAPYNVTKAGVVALSEAMYAELRSAGVGVTVLCPTFFNTSIVASGRIQDPEASAAAQERMDRARFTADDVAEAALASVERGRLYCVPMRDGRIAWRVKRLAPRSFARLLASDWLRRFAERRRRAAG